MDEKYKTLLTRIVLVGVNIFVSTLMTGGEITQALLIFAALQAAQAIIGELLKEYPKPTKLKLKSGWRRFFSRF